LRRSRRAIKRQKKGIYNFNATEAINHFKTTSTELERRFELHKGHRILKKLKIELKRRQCCLPLKMKQPIYLCDRLGLHRSVNQMDILPPEVIWCILSKTDMIDILRFKSTNKVHCVVVGDEFILKHIGDLWDTKLERRNGLSLWRDIQRHAMAYRKIKLKENYMGDDTRLEFLEDNVYKVMSTGVGAFMTWSATSTGTWRISNVFKGGFDFDLKLNEFKYFSRNAGDDVTRYTINEEFHFKVQFDHQETILFYPTKQCEYPCCRTIKVK